MIDQRTLDEVADLLVENGVRVTYDHLRAAFAERSALAGDGASHSDRDIQHPFAAWRQRRRYRPHLAALDLDERTERALGRFLTLARSGDPSGFAPSEDEPATRAQVDRMTGRIEDVLASLAAENAALRSQVDRLITAMAAMSAPAPTDKRPKGRKAGIVASTSLHFWDRLMRAFADEIRKRGPLTAADLHATITPDTHDFARRNFERITPGVVTEKLTTRNTHNKYIRPTDDGRYELIRRSPKRRVAADLRRDPPGKGSSPSLPPTAP
ncbi:hypothetical protein [Methylobacterium sp. D54C]